MRIRGLVRTKCSASRGPGKQLCSCEDEFKFRFWEIKVAFKKLFRTNSFFPPVFHLPCRIFRHAFFPLILLGIVRIAMSFVLSENYRNITHQIFHKRFYNIPCNAMFPNNTTGISSK
ncbi:hypothetical protein CEXT_114291 [Caerostris extrusa]|uniref:Uncharacterized protein n=1 Tax=Caerostris extrusa TaxID=172846 RepID=A0AAV4YAN4_CAEEX|nr:hypothetical protein CEXT_114291 [Caerostris extrusa]